MNLRDLGSLLKQTASEWSEDTAPRLGAALAFYSVLSIAPLLVISLAIAGAVFGEEAARGEIVAQIQGLVGKEGGEAIEEVIANAQEPGTGTVATILGIATLLCGAAGVFGQLQDALNTIWEVKPKPNQGIWGFIRTRFLSFAMVLGIAFLFMVSTVGTTLVTTLGEWVVGADNKIIAGILSHVVSL